MRIFEANGKYNFVDENNVFVGYDSGQICCESASWSITKARPTETSSEKNEIAGDEAGYIFDAAFFEKDVQDSLTDAGLDEGEAVLFRLRAPGDREAFLLLWNCHNGYYGHGFEMTKDGKTLFDGCL